MIPFEFFFFFFVDVFASVVASLYNAVADQLRLKSNVETNHLTLRSQVASYLKDHKDDYLPFMTNDDGDLLDHGQISFSFKPPK